MATFTLACAALVHLILFTQDSMAQLGATSQPFVCSRYTSLSDSWRHIDLQTRYLRGITGMNEKTGQWYFEPLHCDTSRSTAPNPSYMTGGWYRFTGAAGSKLPTAPAGKGKHICGTSVWAWISSGGHPTMQDGIVTREVCWEMASESSSYPCLSMKTTIKVAACRDVRGEYFVYELSPKLDCSFAYCATD